MIKTRGIVVLALSAAANLCADVKLPAVLSGNMVLQQQSNARFWGWAGQSNMDSHFTHRIDQTFTHHETE